jgi:large subunit ribosomal protein L35
MNYAVHGVDDEESTAAMPKNKTHSGAKKRFKVTGTGKVLRQQAGLRHRLEVKSSRETRQLEKDVAVSPADAKTAKRLLGK